MTLSTALQAGAPVMLSQPPGPSHHVPMMAGQCASNFTDSSLLCDALQHLLPSTKESPALGCGASKARAANEEGAQGARLAGGGSGCARPLGQFGLLFHGAPGGGISGAGLESGVRYGQVARVARTIPAIPIGESGRIARIGRLFLIEIS